jgi:hypothetical protein
MPKSGDNFLFLLGIIVETIVHLVVLGFGPVAILYLVYTKKLQNFIRALLYFFKQLDTPAFSTVLQTLIHDFLDIETNSEFLLPKIFKYTLHMAKIASTKVYGILFQLKLGVLAIMQVMIKNPELIDNDVLKSINNYLEYYFTRQGAALKRFANGFRRFYEQTIKALPSLKIYSVKNPDHVSIVTEVGRQATQLVQLQVMSERAYAVAKSIGKGFHRTNKELRNALFDLLKGLRETNAIGSMEFIQFLRIWKDFFSGDDGDGDPFAGFLGAARAA